METKQYVQQKVTTPDDNLAWFKEFNAFWVTGIVPLLLAYMAYKSLKLKVQAHNKRKNEKLQESLERRDEGDWVNAKDETLTSFVTKKLTGKEL